MVVVLKTDKDIEKVKEMLQSRQNKRKFDAKKFCGALKTNEDGLEVQKRLRNEWE